MNPQKQEVGYLTEYFDMQCRQYLLYAEMVHICSISKKTYRTPLRERFTELVNMKVYRIFVVILFYLCLLVVLGQLNEESTSFTCDNGKKIPMTQFCDGNQNCDGSDELERSFSSGNVSKVLCKRSNFTCLIDVEYVCAESIKCEGVDPCEAGCETHYRCQNNKCVKRSTICDGSACSGCKEDDGWETGIGFKCRRDGKSCRIPQQLLYDRVQDCDKGVDLCFSSPVPDFEIRNSAIFNFETFNQSLCFQCLNGSMIIPRERVCDGIFDCSDLSDECLCDREVPGICNGVMKRAHEGSEGEKSCAIGQVDCGDGQCIDRTSMCNSEVDCLNFADEEDSYCGVTLNCDSGNQAVWKKQCRCRIESLLCENYFGILCDGEGSCPDIISGNFWPINGPGNSKDECSGQCANSSYSSYYCSETGANGPDRFKRIKCQYHELSTNMTSDFSPKIDQICDGVIDCNIDGEDEEEGSCNKTRFYCKAKNNISIPISQKCDGVVHCDDASDESKSMCKDNFPCPSRNNTKVSIKKKFVCDQYINCDDATDEVNCTEDGRYYCEDQSPLFVKREQVFDGKPDCEDLSDECPLQTKNDDVFSSRYSLIANPILRVAVWIMGLIAFVGNITVIIGESYNIYQRFGKNEPAPLRTNRMLILNMAIADFLMAIYLLILGISGSILDGFFCIHKLNWLSSTTCTSMGVIIVLSLEASVITVVILTSCRLYAALKPFTASYRPRASAVLALIGISWFIAFTVALTPLSSQLEYIFTEKAIIRDNPFFRNITVRFDLVQTWMQKMLTFDPSLQSAPIETFSNIASAKSWKDLQSVVNTLNKSVTLNISGYIGIYSSHSVCIPKIFVTPADKLWPFSLSVSIFNFVAFLYVACAYLAIVKHTIRKGRPKQTGTIRKKPKADPTSLAMERKVFRLVWTNFCCWVPVSLMVFINFAGYTLSDISYVVSAVLLLPINSALNPILYSSFLDNCFSKLKSLLFKMKSKHKPTAIKTPTASTAISETNM